MKGVAFKSAGFSMIEVLVAFSMMAITTMVVMKIFATGLRSAGVSEDYLLAAQLANGLLEEVKISETQSAPVVSGISAEKYRWHILENVLDQGSVKDGVHLKEVTVRVAWGRTPSERQIELVRLMLTEGHE
jgi:general secretion pathway protein I